MYQSNKNLAATDFPIPDYNLFDAGSYIHGKWKQDNWTISGGIRYDLRVLRGGDFFTKTNPVTGFAHQVSPPDTVASFLQFQAFKKLFSGISLSFGTTYQLTNEISVKANIA